MRGICHHQKRGVIAGDPKIQKRDDMRMLQVDRARLVDELLQVFMASEPAMQDFDSNLSIFMEVFCEIDIAKASTPQPAEQALLTDSLTHPIYISCHRKVPGVI